jgi:hypothetical protein
MNAPEINARATVMFEWWHEKTPGHYIQGLFRE